MTQRPITQSTSFSAMLPSAQASRAQSRGQNPGDPVSGSERQLQQSLTISQSAAVVHSAPLDTPPSPAMPDVPDELPPLDVLPPLDTPPSPAMPDVPDEPPPLDVPAFPEVAPTPDEAPVPAPPSPAVPPVGPPPVLDPAVPPFSPPSSPLPPFPSDCPPQASASASPETRTSPAADQRSLTPTTELTRVA
jgi:hypothetical protein